MVGWLFGWLIGRSVGLLVGRLVDWLVGWLIGRLFGWLICRLFGWLIGRMVGWLVGCLIGRLVVWLFGRSVGWLVGRFVFVYLLDVFMHYPMLYSHEQTKASLPTNYPPHIKLIQILQTKAVQYNLLVITAASGNKDISVYKKYSTKHRVYDVVFSFLCSSPLYIPTDFLRFPCCNLSTIFFPFSRVPFIPPVSFMSSRTLFNRLLSHPRQRASFL